MKTAGWSTKQNLAEYRCILKVDLLLSACILKKLQMDYKVYLKKFGICVMFHITITYHINSIKC